MKRARTIIRTMMAAFFGVLATPGSVAARRALRAGDDGGSHPLEPKLAGDAEIASADVDALPVAQTLASLRVSAVQARPDRR